MGLKRMVKFYKDNTGTKEKPIETYNDISILESMVPANAWYKFTCVNCGKEYIRSFKRYRFDFYKKFLCGECGRESTMIERLGVPHALQNSECINKMMSTNSRKYGKPHYMTYGSKEFKDNMLKLYGDENYCNRGKSVETFNRLFGGNTPFASKEVQNKSKSTFIEKYGVDNPFKDKETRNLCKSTMIDHYGVPYSGLSKELMYKTNATKLKLYGSISVSHRFVYYGKKFDSSWELATWIYFTDNRVPIMRIPQMLIYFDKNGESHFYEPDFMINGMLVEIKGDHYFDSNGIMRYPYKKKKVNGKWIPLTLDEKERMDDLYKRKQKCGIENGVIFWKKSDISCFLEYCDTVHPGWKYMYDNKNIYNPSYWNGYCPIILSNCGYTPYNLSENTTVINDKCSKQYLLNNNIGLTPFS